MNHKEAVTIPKGCVLAFRVRQLMVNGKDEWGEQRPACSPLKEKVACIRAEASRSSLAVMGAGLGEAAYCIAHCWRQSRGCSRKGGEDL